MSYRQYTECVDISNFDPGNPITNALLLGLYITITPAAFAALLTAVGASSPWCLLIFLEIYPAATILGYCYWFLYRRLICLPAPPDHPVDNAGDHIIIGTLIDILPPDDPGRKWYDLDNDYSIDILPQCNPLGAGFDEVANSEPYGYLVKEQPVILNAGLPFRESLRADHKFPDNPQLEKKSQVLHCEFEGRGVYDMYIASRAALFLAIAALFACMIPVYGWIVALILALLSLLGLGGGFVAGNFDSGDPGDGGPNAGDLHLNDENHHGASTLLVKGHWVYDSGHRFDHAPPDGYNELHPITFCCFASPDCGGVIFLERWRLAIIDATSPATLANQKLPQNQWQIYPIIDGCQPVVIV